MSLLNWSQCKQRILEQSPFIRAHRFTRVSVDVKYHLEGLLLREIERVIRSQPSKGMTIAVGTHKRSNNKEEVK